MSTDDFSVYQQLGEEWDHRMVNHSLGEYVRGDAYTNTIVRVFYDLRHLLNTFKGIFRKNLQLFVSMFQFSYNLRHLGHINRLNNLFSLLTTQQ